MKGNVSGVGVGVRKSAERGGTAHLAIDALQKTGGGDSAEKGGGTAKGGGSPRNISDQRLPPL